MSILRVAARLPVTVDPAGYIVMIAFGPEPVNTGNALSQNLLGDPSRLCRRGVRSQVTLAGGYSLIHTKSVLEIASLTRASSS